MGGTSGFLESLSRLAAAGRVRAATRALDDPRAVGARRERALATLLGAAAAPAGEAGGASYLQPIPPVPIPGAVQMPEIMAHLRATLPADAIVTNGAGNYSAWCNRFYSYRSFRSQLAPTSGSMGYGLPAAVAAKLEHPDRPVVCFAGDGCFQMTGQELATACQYRLPIIVLVFDNGMYGTIRMHQEREYPTRVFATELQNPDFVALARAHGANGTRITRTEDFAPAFANALEADRPTLLEITIDPEAITPRQSLSQIRAAALAKQAD